MRGQVSNVIKKPQQRGFPEATIEVFDAKSSFMYSCFPIMQEHSSVKEKQTIFGYLERHSCSSATPLLEAL